MTNNVQKQEVQTIVMTEKTIQNIIMHFLVLKVLYELI